MRLKYFALFLTLSLLLSGCGLKTTESTLSSKGADTAMSESESTSSKSTNTTVSSSSSQTKKNTSETAITSNTFLVNEKTVSFIGRHSLSGSAMAYSFLHSNSGIMFSFKGTSLELYLSASSYKENEYNYVTVYVDSLEPVVIRIVKEGWYTVYDKLDDGIHTVRVGKRSDSNTGTICIHKIRLSENSLLLKAPPPKTSRRIQVLGDSITCGYGNVWDGKDYNSPSKWMDGTNTYATMVAEYFGASLDLVCMSGIGVGNSKNKPYSILPLYKTNSDTSSPFDFNSFVPDVIIIALGTNDYGQGNSREDFIENALILLNFIRSKYPDAHIIWSYGCMGDPAYKDVIQAAIDVATSNGVRKLYFLPTTPPTLEESIGLYGHPTLKTHRRMAVELIKYISSLLSWDKA